MTRVADAVMSRELMRGRKREGRGGQSGLKG